MVRNLTRSIRVSVKTFFLIPLLVSCAYAGGPVKSGYLKAAVQPVTVKKVSDEEIEIRYRIPPETMMYSEGVDYVVEAGQIKVAILRCYIKGNCQPKAATTVSKDMWQGEVRIPYRGEKVIMVYGDLEEQIYP